MAELYGESVRILVWPDAPCTRWLCMANVENGYMLHMFGTTSVCARYMTMCVNMECVDQFVYEHFV